MKKRKKIIIVLVIVVLILAIAGVLIYCAKPVTILEKHLNKQIALNLQETSPDWEIEIYDLHYVFPGELKGKAYLRNKRHDLLIEVNRVILKPQFGTLFKSTQLYQMEGYALGGAYEGSFAIGKNDDFTLNFRRLSSAYIKELSSDEPYGNTTEVVVSGTLAIISGVMRADANIDSIRISLPEPLSMAGDLYFYDGKLSFETVENVVVLKQALIKNADIQIGLTGSITTVPLEDSVLDLYGVLVVSNPVLAYILSLNENGGGDMPEFRFRISGPSSDPSFRLVPPESDTSEILDEDAAAAAETETDGAEPATRE